MEQVVTPNPTTNNSFELPVVVAKNFVGIPSTEIRAEFINPADIRAIKSSESYHNFVVIAYAPDKSCQQELAGDNYKRAVMAKIVLNTTPNPNLCRVKFNIIERCNIIAYDVTSAVTLATVETLSEVPYDHDEANVTKNLIKKEILNARNATSEEQVINQKITMLLSRDLEDGVLCDNLAAVINSEYADKLKYIFEDDISKRLLMVLQDLRKQKFLDELEKKIDDNVRKNMNEAQKEYFLREKMRAIQEELGDKAKKDSEIDELREKIKAKKMPKSMEDKALSELQRYASLGMSTPETGVIRTYLDFVVSLPWNDSSSDNDDIAAARRILDEDHYGLNKVKDRILEYLAVRIMNNHNPQAILCLVGPPGVGKTSIAKSIARALGRKFVKQSLGGVHDEAEIRGHRRTYIGALPGRILSSLAEAGTNNPVFLFDEIDKMGSDYKGDPTSAMLEVFDGEQNQFFSDNYLEEPFDLSKCLFIATANYLENIPAPLRDRFEIVEVSSYTEFEKFEIAKNFLVRKQLEINGMPADKFQIKDEVILEIIRKYTREAGVREVERLIGSIIRKSIKNILIDNKKKVSITLKNLEEYLGKSKFENTENTGKDLVGVVNGLAYTEFGGDILQIEVVHYRGTGKIVLTGKLGDVMKESAETALSYVKANAETYHIDYELFEKNDIHVHVPEGAVPKDGPSAGVTMVTAIVSSFTDTTVNHLIGMTGEITLRGRVLPIGGLREKAIAANRSGLKKILVPKENVRDIDDIPAEVKKELEIIPIENAQEAIALALN